MASLAAPASPVAVDSRFLLRNVTWRTYEVLLSELGDQPVRVTYDRGSLELASPSPRHEFLKRWLGRLIETLTFVLSIPIRSGGSSTFRRADLERGLEPDECYWIQHEMAVRGKNEIDLTQDPPPDLVLEVDITSSSLDREAIYAELRVPEIWRFDGEQLEMLTLLPTGVFETSARSSAFPLFSSQAMQAWMKRSDATDETTRLRQFAAWVQQQAIHPGN